MLELIILLDAVISFKYLDKVQDFDANLIPLGLGELHPRYLFSGVQVKLIEESHLAS